MTNILLGLHDNDKRSGPMGMLSTGAARNRVVGYCCVFAARSVVNA